MGRALASMVKVDIAEIMPSVRLAHPKLQRNKSPKRKSERWQGSTQMLIPGLASSSELFLTYLFRSNGTSAIVRLKSMASTEVWKVGLLASSRTSSLNCGGGIAGQEPRRSMSCCDRQPAAI